MGIRVGLFLLLGLQPMAAAAAIVLAFADVAAAQQQHRCHGAQRIDSPIDLARPAPAGPFQLTTEQVFLIQGPKESVAHQKVRWAYDVERRGGGYLQKMRLVEALTNGKRLELAPGSPAEGMELDVQLSSAMAVEDTKIRHPAMNSLSPTQWRATQAAIKVMAQKLIDGLDFRIDNIRTGDAILRAKISMPAIGKMTEQYDLEMVGTVVGLKPYRGQDYVCVDLGIKAYMRDGQLVGSGHMLIDPKNVWRSISSTTLQGNLAARDGTRVQVLATEARTPD